MVMEAPLGPDVPDFGGRTGLGQTLRLALIGVGRTTWVSGIGARRLLGELEGPGGNQTSPGLRGASLCPDLRLQKLCGSSGAGALPGAWGGASGVQPTRQGREEWVARRPDLSFILNFAL